MPYDPENKGEVAKMKARLEKTYQNVSDKDARQAIHILNSMMESGKGEGAAWGGIHSQLQQKGLKKKGRSQRHSVLATELSELAAKHPKHAEALQDIAKEAAGWVPGELRDDHDWQSGHVENEPTVYPEDGSQVPPKRDNDGNQLDLDGKEVDSIPRVASIDDAWQRLAWQVQGGSPVGQRIYLDRKQCRKLGVPYDNDGAKLVAAADAIIRSKDPWEGYDEFHMDLLKPLGGKTIVAEGDGHGWFKITRVL